MDLQVCASCGALFGIPVVEEHPGGPVLVCGDCGQRHPFRRLPLFALTGPSGGGKSTVGRRLVGELGEQAVVLEQDLLWAGGLRDPADDYRLFRSTWLRLVGMIHQGSRPVVLCGTVVPIQFELCPQRAFVGEIHYLALVCDREVLRERLRARPAWREWDEDRIAEMLDFNDWIRRTAPSLDPPVRLLDTTTLPTDETVHTVTAWVLDGLRRWSESS